MAGCHCHAHTRLDLVCVRSWIVFERECLVENRGGAVWLAGHRLLIADVQILAWGKVAWVVALLHNELLLASSHPDPQTDLALLPQQT